MGIRIVITALLLSVVACGSRETVTENDRQAAISEISMVLDSMNVAWRRADFIASSRPLLDEGLMTFNGYRVQSTEAKASVMKNPSLGFAGQYIPDYTPRYDIPTRDFAITTWENDFARIAMDSTQGPMQVGLMTLVWKRTSDGWRILHYHESTRPKVLEISGDPFSPYAGVYQRADGIKVRFAVVERALNLSQSGETPITLQPFTDPNFEMNGTRINFVRNRDGSVHGVLFVNPDGSSEYAWRISV